MRIGLTRRQHLQSHELGSNRRHARPDTACKSAKEGVNDRACIVLASKDPDEEGSQAGRQCA